MIRNFIKRCGERLYRNKRLVGLSGLAFLITFCLPVLKKRNLLVFLDMEFVRTMNVGVFECRWCLYGNVISAIVWLFAKLNKSSCGVEKAVLG
jgi:hypothetical protein